MSANNPDCIGVIGSTGMGKGLFLVQNILPLLGGDRVLLVWSPLEATDQYAVKFGGQVVQSIPVLAERLIAGAKVLVFIPSQDPKVMKGQFDLFCRAAWEIENCIVLVEELSRVTSASHAPLPWKNLSTAGRHRGIKLYAASQRPAHMDKDFFGACTEIRAYCVGYDDDARALASVLVEPWQKFMSLEQFHYVHLWKHPRRKVYGVQPRPGETVPPEVEADAGLGVPGAPGAPGAASAAAAAPVSDAPAKPTRKRARKKARRRSAATKP